MYILIEILGWLGSFMTIGAYFCNLRGYLKAEQCLYIWFNLLGGSMLVLHSSYHGAYPSSIENFVWAIFAFGALIRKKEVAS